MRESTAHNSLPMLWPESVSNSKMLQMMDGFCLKTEACK